MSGSEIFVDDSCLESRPKWNLTGAEVFESELDLDRFDRLRWFGSLKPGDFVLPQ